jgi:tungstate transport system ATP-binding protein
MISTPAYAIRSLIQVYDGKVVLDIPRLDVPAGEIHAVVGPNGSGKSTLLTILALLLSPSSGGMVIRGSESVSDRDRRRLRRDVTLIHQRPFLFDTTVWNNVSYGLRARGLHSREIKSRVRAALDELGLSALAGRSARKLSGGEAQLAVLARGLVLRTPILLLDEPTSFLDETFRPLLYNLLRTANQERGTTILLATHDLKFASPLAHQILRLEGGRIAKDHNANRASGG